MDGTCSYCVIWSIFIMKFVISLVGVLLRNKFPCLFLIKTGGTAFNGVVEEVKKLTTRVAHVLPVSDDGGSTAEIVRVLGKLINRCIYFFSYFIFSFFSKPDFSYFIYLFIFIHLWINLLMVNLIFWERDAGI